MSTVSDKARDFWDRISPRERRLVLIAGIALPIIIAIWLGASSKLRGAFGRRSAFAFYAIASVVLALCSLGPKPTFAGHQFLYEPPYAWLMRLPIFSAIRVPARRRPVARTTR